MGMKSESYHFSHGAGGPSTPEKQFLFKLNLQMFGKMPKQRAQIMHILADRPNHLLDTPENRKLFENISDDNHNYIRSDKRGFDIYSKVINGKEYWVHVRNGIIQDAGYNIDYRYHKIGGKKHVK